MRSRSSWAIRPRLRSLVKGAQALVTHVGPVTEAVIDAGTDLRIIGCCRGGPVNVNVAAATARAVSRS